MHSLNRERSSTPDDLI